MAKAWVHAESSAKRWGGTPDDYIAIHEKIDQTKSAHAEVTHRCVFHSAFGIFIIEDILQEEQSQRYWAMSAQMEKPLLLLPTSMTSSYKSLYMNQSIVVLISQKKEVVVKSLLNIADSHMKIQLHGKQVTSMCISTSTISATAEKHSLTYTTQDLTLHQDDLLVENGELELLEKHSHQLIPSSNKSTFCINKLIELSRDDSENHYIALGIKNDQKIFTLQFSTKRANISIQLNIQQEICFNKSVISPTDQHFIFLVRRRDSDPSMPRTVFVTIMSQKLSKMLTLVIQQKTSEWLFNKMIDNSFNQEIDVEQTDMLSSLFGETDTGSLPFIKKDSPYIYYFRTDCINSALQMN